MGISLKDFKDEVDVFGRIVELFLKLPAQKILRVVAGDNPRQKMTYPNGDLKDERILRINPVESEDLQILQDIPEKAFNNFTEAWRYSENLNIFLREKEQLGWASSQIDEYFMKFHLNEKYRVEWKISSCNEPVSYERLLQRISRVIPRGGLTRVRILEGEIGAGKSTLASNLAVQIRKQKENAALVVVDVQKWLERSQDHANNFDSNYLANATAIEIERQVLDKIVSEEVVHDHPRTKLISLIQELRQQQKTIVLIYDNCDFVYHAYDLHFFSKTNWQEKMQTYYDIFSKLLVDFNAGDFRRLGINVLFVLRQDTKTFLEIDQPSGLGEEHTIPDVDTFTIQYPSAKELSEMAKRRAELAFDAAEALNVNDETKLIFEKRREDYAKIFDIMGRSKHAGMLYSTSVHGARHVMTILSRLSQISKSKVLTERFRRKLRHFELFFYLLGYNHYSQARTGYTNMFLINVEYRIRLPRDYPEDLLWDHPQTYWLKYLLVQLVATGKVTSVDQAEKLFRNSSYPNHIVSLVLGSLSEVAHGKIFEQDYSSSERHIYPTKISLTDRGKDFLSQQTLWSFQYLQLVIEDRDLKFPKELEEDFKVEGGYEYLVTEDALKHDEQQAKMLYTKMIQTMKFVELLAETYAIESSQNRAVFSLIEEPNFNFVRGNLRNQFKRLVKNFEYGDLVKYKLDKAISYYGNQDNRTPRDPELTNYLYRMRRSVVQIYETNKWAGIRRKLRRYSGAYTSKPVT